MATVQQFQKQVNALGRGNQKVRQFDFNQIVEYLQRYSRKAHMKGSKFGRQDETQRTNTGDSFRHHNDKVSTFYVTKTQAF